MFFPFSIRLLQLWLDYAHKILVVTIYDVHSLDVLQLVAVVKQWVKTEWCQAVAEFRRELKISKVIFQFCLKISLGYSEGLKRSGYQVIHICLWWFLYQSLFNSAETGYFFSNWDWTISNKRWKQFCDVQHIIKPQKQEFFNDFKT